MVSGLHIQQYNCNNSFPLQCSLYTSLRVQECQLHRARGEHPISNKYTFYHTHGVYHSVYVCPPPSLCSCTAYSGTVCTSVFGAANLTNVGGFISIDSVIEATITAARDSGLSEACQNYIRIIQCLAYAPCSGTAWCGSMSPDDLTAALTTACGSGGSQVPLTNNYYQGSSSTGLVGSARLACQDVTLSK